MVMPPRIVSRLLVLGVMASCAADMRSPSNVVTDVSDVQSDTIATLEEDSGRPDGESTAGDIDGAVNPGGDVDEDVSSPTRMVRWASPLGPPAAPPHTSTSAWSIAKIVSWSELVCISAFGPTSS